MAVTAFDSIPQVVNIFVHIILSPPMSLLPYGNVHGFTNLAVELILNGLWNNRTLFLHIKFPNIIKGVGDIYANAGILR